MPVKACIREGTCRRFYFGGYMLGFLAFVGGLTIIILSNMGLIFIIDTFIKASDANKNNSPHYK